MFCRTLILVIGFVAFSSGTASNDYSDSFCADVNPLVDDIQRYRIIQWHTEMREEIARGLARNHHGELLPPAKNLYIMRWNCTLERLARDQTHNCHHSVNTSLPYGQNIMYFPDEDFISLMRKAELIEYAMRQWALAIEIYGSGNVEYDDPRLYTFANMAYSGIYELGCDYKQCSDWYGRVEGAVLFCIYNTEVPGGVKLYEVGTSEGCDDSHCVLVPNSVCLDSLCDAPRDSSSFF